MNPTRRELLLLPIAALAAVACHTERPQMTAPADDRMPSLFVSHGSPMLALDPVAGADFARLAAGLPRPRAALVVSAHWLDAPATIGTRTARELLYDFGGFPDDLYRVRYEASAAADLAERLQALLPTLRRDDQRPWDHGVWVPLLHMFPHADVPVLQLSLPYAWKPRQLFDFGRSLAPLRDEGVLVLGSGGAVHNLRAVDWRGQAPPPAWALDFEGWLRERLLAGAFDDVVAFREKAPARQYAHPTDEHFLPLLVALGAATTRSPEVTFPIEGFELGSMSRLAVRLG